MPSIFSVSVSAHGPGIPIGGSGFVLPLDIILFAVFLAYYFWSRRRK